jgi:hypothetical protein
MWFFNKKKKEELERIKQLELQYKQIAEQLRDVMMNEIIAHHPELEHLMIKDTNARYHLPVVLG